jgi:hypothetical protein
MARYAVINSENVVVNVIIWDGISPWSPPAGHQAILGANRPERDYIYDPESNTFSPPVINEG